MAAGKVARDWVTVMSAINIMHELLDKYEENSNLVDNVEWFILPVANPDGYVFSMEAAAVSSPLDCLDISLKYMFLLES